MRRTALAVAALLAALSPAVAAGSFVTRGVQDGSGFHVQSYYDESGVGTGPFDPVYSLPSGVSAGGGGSGGTVTQGPAGTAPWLATLYQGGSALSGTNPIFVQITAGSAVIGAVTQSGGPWTISGTVTAVPTTGATMTTSQPTVTTTAAALTFSGTAHRELVNPPGNSTIYIGGSSGVTTTTGYPIFQGTSYDVTRFTGSVYAIGTASQTIGLISY